MALELTQLGDTIQVKDSELGAPNVDDEVSYTVQLLTRAKYKEIYKRHTVRVPNKRTHQMEDKTDWDALTEELYDFVLQGWAGININGAPAPCTLENKLALDGSRLTALLEIAGLSRVQNPGAAKASSFRGPEEVR